MPEFPRLPTKEVAGTPFNAVRLWPLVARHPSLVTFLAMYNRAGKLQAWKIAARRFCPPGEGGGVWL